MTDLEKLEIERQCEKLSISYARLLDFGQYDELAELFTIDAVLNAGVPLAGRENIRLGLNKRPAKLRSRHVLTNIHTEILDDETAKGISYLSLYRHIGDESLTSEVIAFDGPAAIGHYSDEFRLEDAVWKIHQRVLTISFRNPKYFARR